MAGRIRTIKPEILDDERTAALSDGAFKLFVGMILLADDYGNLRASPRQLAAAIFWHTLPRDISPLLEEVTRTDEDGSPGLVTLYRVGGEPYAHLNGWAKNQRVDKPGRPRIPGPKDADSPEKAEVSRESRESLARPSRMISDLRSPISDLRSSISVEEQRACQDPELEELNRAASIADAKRRELGLEPRPVQQHDFSIPEVKAAKS